MFCGFLTKEQELKYNITLFDLIMTLAARVNASFKQSKHIHFHPIETPQIFQQNPTEVKVARHLNELY